jgi:stringent starvation protein B
MPPGGVAREYTPAMTDGPPPRMSSHRPYLLRALYAWIADNGMTPHLLVDATRTGVLVPPSAISEGKVVLNVAERAVAGLEMGNETIAFTARFGGVSQPVRVPVSAVLAIYARETGQGMGLPEDIAGTDDAGLDLDASIDGADSEDGGDDRSPPPKRGGHLRVVK